MTQQLGFDAMPVKLVRVTPARLANWEDCPRRYRMTYLDRPTPPRGGAWAHSTMGASVHNALRAFFDLPAQRRTEAEAAALVGKCWKSEGFANDEQSAKYRDRARGWVADYVAELEPGIEPIGLERWVAAPVGTIIAEGRVELHHLPTGEVHAWEHTDESLRRQLSRAEQSAADLRLATDTLEAGGDPDILFEPRPARRCSWCDFRRSCPEGQVAGAEIAPWSMLAP